jgi:OOP family OmpA-OmpF porin
MKFSTKFALGFVAAIALAMTASQAQAKDGWYGHLSAGVGSTTDTDVDVPSLAPINLETTQGQGPVVLGALGQKYPSGFRIEGEISYRNNGFDDFKASGSATFSGVTYTGTNVPVPISGDISSLGFMTNVAYDFMKGKKIHPYVLAGIGAAKISVDSADLADDNDFVFAYQVGAGIKYDVSKKVALGISYRLFGTSDPEFTDGETDFSMEYLNHSVLFGLTYSF